MLRNPLVEPPPSAVSGDLRCPDRDGGLQQLRTDDSWVCMRTPHVTRENEQVTFIQAAIATVYQTNSPGDAPSASALSVTFVWSKRAASVACWSAATWCSRVRRPEQLAHPISPHPTSGLRPALVAADGLERATVPRRLRGTNPRRICTCAAANRVPLRAEPTGRRRGDAPSLLAPPPALRSPRWPNRSRPSAGGRAAQKDTQPHRCATRGHLRGGSAGRRLPTGKAWDARDPGA